MLLFLVAYRSEWSGRVQRAGKTGCGAAPRKRAAVSALDATGERA